MFARKLLLSARARSKRKSQFYDDHGRRITFHRASSSGMSSRQCSSVTPVALASGITDKKSTTTAREERSVAVADLSSRFSSAMVPEMLPSAHRDPSNRRCFSLDKQRRASRKNIIYNTKSP